MHDYHAIEALVERLAGETEPERIAEVSIAASAVFSPEALRHAYEMLTKDTPLEGSALAVEELESFWDCPSCGHSWKISRDDVFGHAVACPSCAALSPLGAGAGVELRALRREK